MRLLITLVVAFGCIATAHARPTAKSTVKSKGKVVAQSPKVNKRKANIAVLTYRELMRLSPKKRSTYLRDMRKLLVMLENRQGKFEVAGLEAELFREQIASLIRAFEFMPQVHADPPSARAAAAGRPSWVEGRGWVCNQTGLVFNARIGTCVLGTPEAAFEIFGDDPCPAGSQKVPDPGYALFDSYWVCVPRASWDQLTPARQENVRTKRWLPIGFFKGKDQAQTVAEVAGRPASTSGGVQPRADDTVPVTSGTADNTIPGPAGSPLQGPDDVIREQRAAAALANTNAPAEPAMASEDAMCAEGAFTCQDIYDLKAADPNSEAYLAASAAVNLFRADRTPGSNVCIWGGFFSSYPGPEKRRGTCSPVRSFPAGRASVCGANETLCNPVLFCLATDVGDGVKVPQQKCVPYGRTVGFDITRRCNIWYEQVRTSGTSEVVRNGQTFSNVPTTTCDPGVDVKFNNDVGLQEEWANMKATMDQQFTKWCMPQTGSANFQALFCSECKVMAAIRARAVGGCAGSTTAPVVDQPIAAEPSVPMPPVDVPDPASDEEYLGPLPVAVPEGTNP